MRRIFNTILDQITGHDLKRHTSRILEMDSWSRDQIDAYQNEMLERLKSFAVKSEIYRECKNWQLSDFPVYTKDFYRNNAEKFLTNFRKPYRIEATSGSTGTPRNVVVSKEMIIAKRAAHQRMLNWFGIKREDKEVYIGGLNKNLKFRLYYFFKNKHFFSSYNIDQEKAEKYIRSINRFKPAVIFAYPYSIDLLLTVAEEKGLQIYQPKLIYTGAENLYPHIEEKIRNYFPKSRLGNEYWSTEGNIATVCPHGRMHVDEDTVIIEIENPEKDGTGNILITNLMSYDFPLIRYRLGDRVRLSEKKCSCGRNSKVIEEITGRDIDYFELPDGRKIAYTENSIQIAEMSKNITSYQVIYNKLNQEIVFKFVKNDSALPVQKERIAEYFKNHFNLKIHFQEVDHIETDSSGKFKIFKSV